MALTCLKVGTECGNNWVKTPIYSAPAVKGLKLIKNEHSRAYSGVRVNVKFVEERQTAVYYDFSIELLL